MKHINLSVVAALALIVLITGCVGVKQGADKGQTLTAPPAPFAARKVLQAMPEIKELATSKRSTGGTTMVPVKQYGVFCGDNALKLNLNNPLSLDISIGGQPAGNLSYWGATAFGSGSPFKGDEPVISYEKDAKSITIKKKFLAGSATNAAGEFIEQIKLLDDGLVDVNYSYQLPEGAKVTDKGVFLSFYPFKIIEGTKVLIDGKPYSFSGANDPAGDRKVFAGDVSAMVFSPEKPEKTFSIVFPVKTSLEITERRQEKDKGTWYYRADIRIHPHAKGEVNFHLDMRSTSEESLKSADTFAGINFWKDDRLHIPDYGKCRNLAPNPSFEAGLRYYAHFCTWVIFKERSKPVFQVDDAVAKFGSSSLRINAVKDEKLPGFLQTFTIPTEPGKKYTFSFYIKGDKDGLWLDTRCVSGVWLQFPKVPGSGVSKDWKRYSTTVTAPNNALTFLLTAQYFGKDPSGEGCLWVDGFQIEEGETATDYVEKPLSAILLTSDPDNLLGVNDKEINARLKITAAPNTAGGAECALEDFFYNTAWKQTITFKTDEKGVAIVSLPLDKALGTGVYVLRADFTLKDGYKDSDYFRIARMSFLNNTHKNKNICGTAIGSQARTEDFLKRARDIGVGSARSVGKAKEFSALEAKYGITVVHEYFLHGGKVLDVDGIFENRKSFREIEKLPEGAEKRIEDAAYEMVKAYPWIDRWCLTAEAEGSKLVSTGNYKDFVRAHMACYKAVKRFDPNKKFFLGGSCNMEPRNGTMYVDKYLEAVKELDPAFKFDGVTIHPYRTTPEVPDLDDDAAAFFAMLDKYGYQNIPAYWDEGIYYPRYNIPAWGLDPHRGCSSDHYNAGCPSYHMGWGERISAAYNARSWLVALKYQDRVKMFIDNDSIGCMDAYLAPMAVQKIPNTLGNILGNAVFKKDIRFAPEMRCYVFEDENKHPVAALWSHNPNVDRGFEPSPKAAFNFKGISTEFIDLMENRRSVGMDKDGNCEIPVTPFPLFIRGGAGEVDKLCASIQNARALNASKLPLQISAKPVGASELEVSVVNLVTRDFNGKVLLNIGGKTIEKDLALKSKGSQKIVVPLSAKIPADSIAEIKLPLELAEAGFKPVKTDLTFTAFTVKKLGGAVPDWEKIPSIKMTNRNIYKTVVGGTTSAPITEKAGYPGDFGAEYQMAWNAENLYLRVNITDDVLFHNANKKDVGSRHDNDSLQIYIDTLCDARSKEIKGYDGNDYNYDFYPNMMKDSTSEPDGTIIAYRRNCPEQQLIGGLFAVQPNTVEPEIKGSFKKTDKGYAYEVVMPKRLIAPVELKSGSVSGFAIYLNDHDGKYIKSGLSTTSEPGTGGWRNPHLYPVMLLTE